MKAVPVLTDEPRPLRADALRSRAKVVAAAQVVLLEDPSASMDDIARAAGVGRSTVFRHFSHRDDLVRTAWIDAAAQAADEIEALDLTGLSPGAALDELVGAAVTATHRHPLLARGARPPVDDPELTTRIREVESTIAATLRDAAADGDVRQDLPTALLVEHLLGCVQSVVLAGLPLERAVDHARSLFRTGAQQPARA